MIQFSRPRRLRTNEAIRSLVREISLSANDFIAPLFIVEGKNLKEPIESMPDYFRYSLDNIKDEINELSYLGVKAVLLFVKVADKLKDNKGTEAINPNGLMQRAIKTIKDLAPEMLVMTDVALDPYSAYGHDGIVEGNQIINDETIKVLAEMSLSHAQAGADVVAPSDMMDGRISAIRHILEEEKYANVGIMSYTVKYASSFYGPFRDALDSAPGFGDKKTYQMDFSNRTDAIREALLDEQEGADILMVKPAMAYLDILRDIKNEVTLPLAAYQVSGEYAMIKAASEKGWINHDAAMIESLLSIKRAGANMVATYFAKSAIKLLS